jgi:hypothetical protein
MEMMNRGFSGYQIDTDDVRLQRARDVMTRVEHLEQLRQSGPVDLGDEDNSKDQDQLFDELATLESLLSDLEGNGGDEEWRGAWYPATLIRESHFKDYAQELADDIGAINTEAGWPNNHIDWDAAADELLIDYTSTEFDGVTYYYR